jgi:hypothetical protein
VGAAAVKALGDDPFPADQVRPAALDAARRPFVERCSPLRYPA